jgi:hypothetical protein
MMKKLFAGISFLAFATSAAHAQVSYLTQTGDANHAAVDNVAAENQNDVSTIIQNGTDNDSIVFQRGDDHQSQIQQYGTSNLVVHRQYDGERGYSESRQGARSGASDDQTSIIRQIGLDNYGVVLQDGLNNTSTVNQGAAVVGDVIDFRATMNNRATVDQIGSGLASTIEQRGATSSSFDASDNAANVRQRASGGSAATQQTSLVLQEARGNFAEVFQFEGGGASPVISSITQRNTSAVTNSPALNTASVAQRGLGNQSSLVQDGQSNIAYVTMLQGATASAPADGNVIRIEQVGQSLTALTVAGGNRNVMDARQSGTANTALIWQMYGSADNSIALTQGRGAAAQSVNGSAPTPGPAADASANFTQNGSLNSATVAQDGASLQAIVEQFGMGIADPTGGTGTAGTYRNLVTIEQTGSDQFARAFQAPTVSASGGSGNNSAGPASGLGYAYGYGGGRRSAEIVILQSNSGNRAVVEQYGRGQVARIEQSGTGGNASIFQDTDATNATAVIQQLGTNNVYTVRQSMAGAYIQVRQTGNGNEATTVTPPSSTP